MCGVAVEGKAAEVSQEAGKEMEEEEEDDSVRIVNGWSARPRPWMALVRAVDEVDPEDYDTCGGAVVNARYILTAGHCVCMRWSARTPCGDGGQLEYDPPARIRVYVGLNDARVEEELRRARADHERRAEAVFVHPGWTGDGLTMPDLALIRVEGVLTFSLAGRNAVSPICLPSPGLNQGILNLLVTRGRTVTLLLHRRLASCPALSLRLCLRLGTDS